MSIILAAEKYAELKDTGLTIDQISEQTGVPVAAIRERLQLLTLTTEEQQMVKDNKLTVVKALKICERRSRAESTATARANVPPASCELP